MTFEENEKLASKIADFQVHLDARAKHVENQKQARSIEKQLLAAKQAQLRTTEQQRTFTSEGYQSHLEQLRQQEVGLELQYAIMQEQLGDTSFQDSALPVFQQCDEQLAKMMLTVDADREETERLSMNRADKEHKLEKIKRCTTAAKKKIEDLKSEQIPLQEQCRTLQTRRAELTKILAATMASQAPPIPPRYCTTRNIHHTYRIDPNI